jgi:multidrug efflux system membrane fusion protein
MELQLSRMEAKQPRKIANKLTNVVAGITGLFMVTAFSFGCRNAESAAAPPPPTVSVAPVIERQITEWDEFTGRLDAVQKVEIRPRVSGYIDKVAFTEGKEVRAGDLLFQIDPRPYQAELDKARAEEERVKTRSVLAKQEVDRAEKMLAKRAISQEEMDERTNALQESVSAIASAKAAVEQAALNVEFTHITSPIDGRVSRTEITRGNLVAGGPGATLLTTVVSLNPIYAYFDGDEQSYLKYVKLARNGQLRSSRDVKTPVYMGLANEDGYPHQGYIDFLDNQVNAAAGTIRIRAIFDNRERLFTPGLFAKIKIVGSGNYKAILVRDSAVGTDQDKKYVLRLAPDGTVQSQFVQLGPLVDGLRIIREGLKPGDKIVVNGTLKVRSGMQVKAEVTPMEETEKSPAASGAGR